jgi:hypothetical protein
MSKPTVFAVLPLFAALGLFACNSQTLTPSTTPTVSAITIRGIVRDQAGPVKGAIVRALGTNRSAISAEDGTFALDGLTPGRAVNLSAWASGYFCRRQK